MAELYQVRNGLPVPIVLGGGDSTQIVERVDALETRVEAVEAHGNVSLSDAVDSDSSVVAASSKAVKTAYDKAIAATTAAPQAHKASHKTGGSDALTPADIGAAPSSHATVAATASTAGHVTFGTAAGTACEGSDARLSDARAPTAHTHTKSQISDLGKATNAAVGLVRGDGVTTTVADGALSVIASVEATADSIVKRDADGNIVGNITGHATWADLAEVYVADEPLEEGDVVRVSPDEGFDVARAVPGSPVLGVVSLRPGVLLNCGKKDEPQHYAVARVGMVPVRVRGPVTKGGRLTAGADGSAVASTDGTGFAFANETKRDEAERLVMCIL